MKKYTVKFSATIFAGSPDAYSPVRDISFDVTEALPANVDAQQYLRRRLAEEVKRHFDAMVSVIENKTEDAPEEDPLAV